MHKVSSQETWHTAGAARNSSQYRLYLPFLPEVKSSFTDQAETKQQGNPLPTSNACVLKYMDLRELA